MICDATLIFQLSTARSALRAKSRYASPAGVSATRRVLREKRAARTACSSCATRLLTTLLLTPRASAAALTLRCSATYTKAASMSVALLCMCFLLMK